MRVVTITGDHPRHGYFVRQVAESGLLAGTIVEQRESFSPEAPEDLSTRLAALFRMHFDRREAAEQCFFGGVVLDGVADTPALTVSRESLNGPDTVAFLKSVEPDLILSYGCHMLKPPVLACARSYAWNVHGGLSPWYRGVATHFWPSYMLEPQMTGMTLHETTDQLDGGAIVHQTGVEMVRGDGLHDLACRALQSFADEMPAFLRQVSQVPEPVTGIAQRTTGRLWTVATWRPEHLVVIYDHFEDRIVDRVLDGEIAGRKPLLVTVATPAPD